VDGLGGGSHVVSVFAAATAYRVGTVSKPRVAVVFGGRSSEHSISCISAGSVIAALDPDKYDVVPVGIAPDGRWVLESAAAGHLALGPGGELPSVTGDREVALTPGQGLVVTEPGDVPDVLGEVDVVFPVMHGPWGQDGTLQGLLEMAGVRYVGAGVLSSAVGTDKHFMKQLFLAAGLPVLPYVLVRPRQWEQDPAAIREAVEALDYPVFVKPARAGSSFGISRVDSADGLDAAIEEARRYDPKVLVETGATHAREVEIGVLQGLDGGDPETSEIAEIKVGAEHAFYDFEAKYLEESFQIPASLHEDVVDQVRSLAVRAFEALDVEGLARVDFFVLADNRVVVNEVETMPGFTATSMFPLLWQASGLTYPELVERLVRLAMERSTGLR
jgi:D-alanine-D-alanine ligase